MDAEREDAEAAFEGSKGTIIRPISDDCSSASYRKAAENMKALSLLRNRIATHVFTKPAVIPERKGRWSECPGDRYKEETSLVRLCGNRRALPGGYIHTCTSSFLRRFQRIRNHEFHLVINLFESSVAAHFINCTGGAGQHPFR